MAKTSNPFAKLQLDRSKFPEGISRLGGTGYGYALVGKVHQMTFQLEGKPCMIGVYENGDGSTTLTRLGTIDPESYAKVAQALVDCCLAGDGRNFSVAIPRFPEEQFKLLHDFLLTPVEEDGVGATLVRHEVSGCADLFQYKGPQGHTLTVKRYTNKTLQLQGLRTKLAEEALDFFSSVLPYEAAVSAQLETYEVKVSVAEVSSELEGRLPNAFSRLHDVVKAQLTSALALTKVNIELPDYGAVAFPALRGLEGFLRQKLQKAKCDVKKAKDFGEYFEEDGVNGFKMRDITVTLVGQPKADFLTECYVLFNRQRHGVAHVGRALEDTRVVGSLTEAIAIVDQVLATIERYCFKIPA